MKDASILAAVAVHMDRGGPPVGVVSLRCDGGVLFLEGEMASLSAKRRLLTRVAKVPGVLGIVDRLLVQPVRRMGDGELVQGLGRAFLAEECFAPHAIRVGRPNCLPRLLRGSQASGGAILSTVRDGVVSLTGTVPRLFDKCLAETVAWCPGTREVINGLAVDGIDDDLDSAATAAIRLGIVRHLAETAGCVRVKVRHGVAWLSGWSACEPERVETIAWQVFGIERVVSRIVGNRD